MFTLAALVSRSLMVQESSSIGSRPMVAARGLQHQPSVRRPQTCQWHRFCYRLDPVMDDDEYSLSSMPFLHPDRLLNADGLSGV